MQHTSRILCCLIFSLLVLWNSFAFGNKSSTKNLPWTQAEIQRLSQHPYWLRLLHFPAHTPMVGEWRSEIQSTSFFLDPDGEVNPAAELRKTLEALFSPVESTPDAHAQCRFIARFHWLKTKLDFAEITLPNVRCSRFEQWLDLQQVDSLSLIFVSAFMGNPASMYGHALLRLNYREDYKGRNLLAPTFSYGAVVDPEDSSIAYLFKGLSGGYLGKYADQQFYNFHHEYGETELRDLWEYELNLNREQQRRVIFHAWELLAGKVKFPYYFLTDNCVFRLTDLLDHAWDETRFNSSWVPWRITLDAFLRLKEMKNRGEPLVKRIRLIPSRQRRLEIRMLQLPDRERLWVGKLIAEPEVSKKPAFQDLPETTQARIVDAAVEYYGYRLAENKDKDLRSQKFDLLRLRSRLPIIEQPKDEDFGLSPPTEGTPAVQIRLGSFYNPHSGNSLELGFRSSYHDLLGRPDGHLPNTHLETLSARFRLRKNGAELNMLEFFNLRTFDVNLPDLPQTSGISWQTRFALEQRDLSCSSCRVLRFNVGWGKAMLWDNNILLFGLLDTFAQAGVSDKKQYALGVAPVLGSRISDGGEWRVSAEAKFPQTVTGTEVAESDWRVEGQWTLSRRWDVRMSWRRIAGEEFGMLLNYYW